MNRRDHHITLGQHLVGHVQSETQPLEDDQRAGAALAHPGSTEALAGIELVMHLAIEHVFWPLIVVLVVGGLLMRRRKEVSS